MVIGIPQYGEVVDEVNELAEYLREFCPVETMSEDLSTSQAEYEMKQQGKSLKDQKRMADSVAARLILED